MSFIFAVNKSIIGFSIAIATVDIQVENEAEDEDYYCARKKTKEFLYLH